MVEKAPICSRGGARHGAAPKLDESEVFKVFKDHKDMACNFGAYERKGRSDQPDASAIVLLFDFIMALLCLCPSGDFGTTIVKKCYMRLCVENPRMNGTPYNNGIWAGLRQERCTTLFFIMFTSWIAKKIDSDSVCPFSLRLRQRSFC